MPLLVVGDEGDLAGLNRRLFGRARVARDTMEQARVAVAAANPGVDLDALAPGTVLRVPDAAGTELRGRLDLDDATKAAVEGLAGTSQQVLDEVLSGAEQRRERAVAERRDAPKLLGSQELRRAAAQDEHLTRILEQVESGLAEAEERDARGAELAHQAHAEWSEGIAALRERFG